MTWLFAGEWVVQAPDRPGSLVVESIEEQAGDHHGRDYLGMAVSTLGGTGNKEPGKLPSKRGGWAGPKQAWSSPLHSPLHPESESRKAEWPRSSEPAALPLFGVSCLSFPLKPSLG